MKRALITALWFLATWSAGGYVALALDLSRSAMLVPAVIVAIAVWRVVPAARRSPIAVMRLRVATADA